MSGRCSPGPGFWISGSPRPGTGTDGSSSVTSTEGPSSGAGSQGSLFTMTSAPSAPTTSEPSTASLAASRARERRAPGSGLGSLILRLRYGPSSSELFARYNPDGSWSRTYPRSSLFMGAMCGERFSGIWPRSGMTWRGIAFRLPPSALRTAVTGSSPLLPTPMARTQSGTQVSGDSRTGGPMLEEALKLLPSNGASTSPPSGGGSTSTGLRLNPSFVEWMMGAPACAECGRGWTDIDCPHSVTAYTSTSPGSSARRSP
jgi:hypothetical protein